jgi:hypothetical protein
MPARLLFGRSASWQVWIVRAVWQSRMLGVARVSPARSASRRLCSALAIGTAPVGLRCACDQGIRWDLMTTARWCNLPSNSPQSIVEMLGRPPRDRGEEQIKLLQHASQALPCLLTQQPLLGFGIRNCARREPLCQAARHLKHAHACALSSPSCGQRNRQGPG